jgi:uncharacterized MAPEG superfamily protein
LSALPRAALRRTIADHSSRRLLVAAAYWCLLLVVLLPYFLSVAARSSVPRTTYVADPRAYSDTLEGWRRRAHMAHLNAFEAVPALLSGVVVAELAQAPRLHVDALAVAFVCARLAHAALYLTNRPTLRSYAWKLGMVCVIVMFVDAALFGHSV